MVGEIWWSELITSDTKAAKEHYSKMAGWTWEDSNMLDGGTYTVFSAGDKMVAGMQEKQAAWGEVPDHWMTYISVPNVEKAISQNNDAGGKLLSGPFEIPVGRFAVIADPTGATLAVATPAQ